MCPGAAARRSMHRAMLLRERLLTPLSACGRSAAACGARRARRGLRSGAPRRGARPQRRGASRPLRGLLHRRRQGARHQAAPCLCSREALATGWFALVAGRRPGRHTPICVNVIINLSLIQAHSRN